MGQASAGLVSGKTFLVRLISHVFGSSISNLYLFEQEIWKIKVFGHTDILFIDFREVDS